MSDRTRRALAFAVVISMVATLAAGVILASL